MSQRQPRPERDLPSPSIGNGTPHRPGGVRRESPEYDVLLSYFGEAMLRIAQLEAQLASVNTENQEDSGGAESPHLASPRPDIRRSAAPSEPLQGDRKRARNSSASSNQPVVEANGPPGSSRESPEASHSEQLRQLKLQVKSQASMLAQTRGEVQELKGYLLRRRGHKERPRSRWSRLVRRFGLGEPHAP